MADTLGWVMVVLLMTGGLVGGCGENSVYLALYSAYAEMICVGCVTMLPYIQHYSGLAVTKVAVNDDGTSTVQVEEKEDVDVEEKKEQNISKENVDQNRHNNIKQVDTDCHLPKPVADLTISCSMFLPMGWRSSLCKCSSCVQMYQDTNTSFLTEDSDTVHHYESQARDRKGTLEQGMEALSQLDRVKQVEAIHSYNNMKENLMEYLAKFADSKKVVREDDIRTFFEVSILLGRKVVATVI